MRVVDASVGFKWLVTETNSDKALSLYGDNLIAPDIFPTEVTNALQAAEWGNRIKDAQLYLGELMLYLPTLHNSTLLLPRALEIASQARRSIYDCLYVALAERENCELVTADTKLLNAIRKDYPFVIPLDAVQP